MTYLDIRLKSSRGIYVEERRRVARDKTLEDLAEAIQMVDLYANSRKIRLLEYQEYSTPNDQQVIWIKDYHIARIMCEMLSFYKFLKNRIPEYDLPHLKTCHAIRRFTRTVWILFDLLRKEFDKESFCLVNFNKEASQEADSFDNNAYDPVDAQYNQ